jgi:hypothetical protein
MVAAGVPLTMLVAGPPEKKGDAMTVVAAAGFDPKFVGPIRYARNLEVCGLSHLPST